MTRTTEWSRRENWSNVASRIFYKSSVRHDLKQIDPKIVTRILREIRVVIGRNPRAGEPLAGQFKGLFKLRIGEYRIIYTIIERDVLILRIRHRGKAYE